MRIDVPRVLAFLASTSAACTTTTPVHPTVSAPTTVADDAKPLVDAWRNAVGGADAIAKLGAWHAVGTYKRGGVTGTIDVLQAPDGRRIESISQGFLNETRRFDGARGWLVDRNGQSRELAGFELDDQLADAYVGTWSALVGGRRAGAVTRVNDDLVLTPVGGRRPVTVTFDPHTHLPRTLVRRDAEKQRVTTLEDYREVGDVRVPFRVRDDLGNPHRLVEIEWKKIERTNIFGVMEFPPRTPVAGDASVTGNPVTVPIEVVYGGLIFVKVDVNGVPMSFVFDTGAESTVLNSSRLGKLGLTGLGQFATGAGGGDVTLSYVRGVTTALGGAVTKDQIVAAIDLDDLEAPLRRPLDGILGYDFISRFAIEIDYRGGVMRLYDPRTYRHGGGGTLQAMSLEDSTPYIDAVVDTPNGSKLTGHFVLDTGCLCDLQLFTPFVDQHGLLAQLPEAKQAGYGAGAGGETHSLSAELPALAIGDVVIETPRVDLSRDGHGATADPESAGLIGSLAFGRYVLALDYARQQFALDPRP